MIILLLEMESRMKQPSSHVSLIWCDISHPFSGYKGKHAQQKSQIFRSKKHPTPGACWTPITSLCGTAASWNPHRLEGLAERNPRWNWPFETQWAMASTAEVPHTSHIIWGYSARENSEKITGNNKWWLANHANLIRFAAKTVRLHTTIGWKESEWWYETPQLCLKQGRSLLGP